MPFPQFEVQVHLVTTFRVGHQFLLVLSASPPHLYPQFMQGAIAAGNKVTAEAGASMLAEGGNAIDACIVAAFAAAVAEGPLTWSNRRRLPARVVRRRGHGARLLLRRTVAPVRRDRGHHRRLRRLDAELPHRCRVGGGAGNRGQPAGYTAASAACRGRSSSSRRSTSPRAASTRPKPSAPAPDPCRGPPARRGRPPDLRCARADRDDRLRGDTESASATRVRPPSTS